MTPRSNPSKPPCQQQRQRERQRNGSAVKSLVDHVEQIKENLKNVIRDLNNVIDTVKAGRQGRRAATDKEIDAIRTKLRQIQNVTHLIRPPAVNQSQASLTGCLALLHRRFNGSKRPRPNRQNHLLRHRLPHRLLRSHVVAALRDRASSHFCGAWLSLSANTRTNNRRNRH